MARRRHHALLEVHAHCLDCRWEQHQRNAKGLAAQHHDKTSHTVDVVEVVQTSYGFSVETPAKREALARPQEETLL